MNKIKIIKKVIFKKVNSGFLPVIIAIVAVAVIVVSLYLVRIKESKNQKIPDLNGIESMSDYDKLMMGETIHDSDSGIMINGGNKLMVESSEVMQMMGDELTWEGEVLAGSSSPLLIFNKIDYDKAIGSNKLVILYFYANWCPVCKAEVTNGLIPMFNEITGNSLVGFRINYKDSDTQKDEEELARQYGISVQHTKVFVKNGNRILKSPESWNKERYVSEVNKALAQ